MAPLVSEVKVYKRVGANTEAPPCTCGNDVKQHLLGTVGQGAYTSASPRSSHFTPLFSNVKVYNLARNKATITRTRRRVPSRDRVNLNLADLRQR
jgi:hypothetical protein